MKTDPSGRGDCEWLVIGAAGLVGSHIREVLADRRIATTFHRTPATGSIQLDVTDRSAVIRTIGRLRPSVIVIASAEPHVERCELEPGPTRLVNVDGARYVAEAARQSDALVVSFSSEYVFGGTQEAYLEADPLGPINEYGRQKVEMEAVVSSLDRHLVCRVSGVFGWERLRKNFVCQLVDRLRAGQAFEVAADQLVTPTPATDLALAVVDLVDRGCMGLYHVVGPEILSRVAFARMAARAFGLPEELVRPRSTAELGGSARRPRCGLRDHRLRTALGHGLSLPAEALLAMRAREESSLPVSAAGS